MDRRAWIDQLVDPSLATTRLTLVVQPMPRARASRFPPLSRSRPPSRSTRFPLPPPASCLFGDRHSDSLVASLGSTVQQCQNAAAISTQIRNHKHHVIPPWLVIVICRQRGVGGESTTKQATHTSARPMVLGMFPWLEDLQLKPPPRTTLCLSSSSSNTTQPLPPPVFPN